MSIAGAGLIRRFARLFGFLGCLLLWGLSNITFLGAYEVTLHGGPIMDIPAAWFLDESDPAVPSWYSPDRRGGVEVRLWAPGTWESMDDFLRDWSAEDARGETARFAHWDGEAALADWSFAVDGIDYRGWFLFTTGSGPDVRVSAIAAEEDYEGMGAFLLSAVDSYSPARRWNRSPGAVGRFLEITGDKGTRTVSADIAGRRVVWENSPAGDAASQDIIEREAAVLAAYAGRPELFTEAWRRYYRLIFRDSYSRLTPLAEALKSGPLPPEGLEPREAAEGVLQWLQGFSYGSTDGFSDLLAPSAAGASGIGDCDSLALVLLILMDSYGVDGRLLISHQAGHALAALDVPGEGLRYAENGKDWLAAELTAPLPLGELPSRLNGVKDWFGIDLLEGAGYE